MKKAIIKRLLGESIIGKVEEMKAEEEHLLKVVMSLKDTENPSLYDHWKDAQKDVETARKNLAHELILWAREATE